MKKKIQESINSGTDLIGRDDTYNKINIDNTYPKYLIENMNLYEKWIVK